MYVASSFTDAVSHHAEWASYGANLIISGVDVKTVASVTKAELDAIREAAGDEPALQQQKQQLSPCPMQFDE